MTLPDERIMALKQINDFLFDLAHIRKREDRLLMARKLLRHYPTNSDIEYVRDVLMATWFPWLENKNVGRNQS